MLSRLPPEIIYLVATYLPTASALARLAQTCKRLHGIICAENWRIFRAFVTTRFPGIDSPPFWRDAAQALTSRSRALDKHAVIGRFVVHPSERAHRVHIGSNQTTRTDNPTLGYRPTIDSYEVWNGTTWADRKEVLAWGAAHEIVMLIKQHGKSENRKWLVFNDLDMISSHDDICGLHVLRPEHYGKEADKEHLIFGRMRGELVHLAIDPGDGTHEHKQRFETSGLELERIDLSQGSDPILAAHLSNGSVAFYRTTTSDAVVQPFGNLRIDPGAVARNKYSKFLSPSRFAVGTGRHEDALTVSTISQDRISLEREIAVDNLDLDVQVGLTPRATVSAISPLHADSSAGNVFLAAWGDRAIRLHDLRSHQASEFTYQDPTDQNITYCIHPFGYNRFITGAGGDAVVKIFDLRMPKAYNYLDARASPVSTNNKSHPSPRDKPAPYTNGIHNTSNFPRKDFSLFLSHPAPSQPNLVQRRTRAPRSYRGAIYTMSSPSPLSPTIYAGIADGVVRLDFASTDDLNSPYGNWYRDPLDLDIEHLGNASSVLPERILQLSGYERPEPRETNRSSKLRTQQAFGSIGEEAVKNEQLTGWDRRWKPLERPGAWRRQG
ncbi:hypothetical protein BDV25DRAFT_163056 [Aspergillus avenaceus]|uniref:F-box domain-containing protein n=1 Tax=Aspergillus avenaceus TaxID=36643 RepID=A0A5N6TIF5_ASPAV|nr:hypothetical protein BDV25DRAFT_163056 [Aspergillus avenaceus]